MTPFFVLIGIISYTIISLIDAPNVLINYRFARALSASLCGLILAISGCFLQSSLRNPLVDHYILGIGSGALLFTYLSILITNRYSLTSANTMAVIGGLIALALTISIAEKLSGSDVAYILSGISVTTLFSGLSMFSSHYVVTRYRYASVLMTGSFVIARKELMPPIILATLITVVGYLMLAKRLNVIILGDEYAKQLGVNPVRTRTITSIIAGISSSIVISIYGLIGFVGLISPHMARAILKTSDNRLVIPLAATIGALLLYFTDLLSRNIMAPVWGEVPSGSIVSLIGAPFFIILLLTRFTRRVT
ncbi:MAG: iron ABC transporter permease [Desulfurococcaceae archaeon]